MGAVWRRATGWTARVRFPRAQDFSLLHSFHTDSEAHPVSEGTFPGGGGRQGCEADHSPPSTAEVKKKNVQSPVCLHGIYLTN
jgi:hypothetical protein